MALSGAPRDGSTEPPSVATVGFTSNFRFPSEAAIRSAWAAYELCAGIKKDPFGPACPAIHVFVLAMLLDVEARHKAGVFAPKFIVVTAHFSS